MQTRNQSQPPSQQPKPAQASTKACGGQGLTYWQQIEAERARELAKLDAQMRGARGHAEAVRGGVAFLVRAVELQAVDGLNELAEYVPRSQLSERSLDRVFEEGEVTDDILREVLARADSDDSFFCALVRAFGVNSIETWRRSQADLPTQGVLL